MATMFLKHASLSPKNTQSMCQWDGTYWSVGTIPLGPVSCVAPGVVAGVAGVEALLDVGPSSPFNPLAAFFSPTLPYFSDDGGVRSPAPPGKDSDEGEVNAFACCAVDGWVWRVSMTARV